MPLQASLGASEFNAYSPDRFPSLYCSVRWSGSALWQPKDSFPAAEWEHPTPAESGWSERGLAQAARAFLGPDPVERSRHRSSRQGWWAEWGNTTKPTELASIRKSLLSAPDRHRGVGRSGQSRQARSANSASTIIRLP